MEWAELCYAFKSRCIVKIYKTLVEILDDFDFSEELFQTVKNRRENDPIYSFQNTYIKFCPYHLSTDGN